MLAYRVWNNEDDSIEIENHSKDETRVTLLITDSENNEKPIKNTSSAMLLHNYIYQLRTRFAYLL